MLSSLEIRAAARVATEENGSLSDEEMTVAVSRLLGFKRTGSDLKIAILKALQLYVWSNLDIRPECLSSAQIGD